MLRKNIYQIKQGILVDFNGEFEMVGNLSLEDQIRGTHIRFRNMVDFESYINAVDEGYEAGDAIFNGYTHKSKTPQFNLCNRTQYGNGFVFKREIIENRGNICSIPTRIYCFVKSINFITGQDYKQQHLDFF